MYHLRLLHCARALAVHRHFGRAADAIGITQPGLTQAIARLEAHYGVRLFQRGRGGVAPTAYGDVLLQGATQVLDRVQAISRELRLLDELEAGELVVGVDPMLASALLAPALTKVLHKHPRLRFTVTSGSLSDVLPALLNHEMDLYLGFPQQVLPDSIAATHLDLPAPVVVGAADHPLAGRTDADLQAYLAFPLVQGPVARWFLDWAAEQLGDGPEAEAQLPGYFLRANDLALLLAIASGSQALLAAMPQDVAAALKQGNLVQLDPPNWPRRVPGMLARAANRPPPPAAERLAAELLRLPEVRRTATPGR